MQKWGVDVDYVPTLGIQMIKGRNFSPSMPTDSGCFIINEAAAALLNRGDPLKQFVYEVEDSGTVRYPILGVFKNFNFNSLRETITPLALRLRRENGSITLRVTTKDIPHLLAQVQDKWKALAPSQPFDYAFLDDTFAAQFAAEQRIGKISVTFSVLAILIACLGLFGLVTYATAQRRKEIGVRKVLGAGLADILLLLCKDFVRLVAIGILIASPLAAWAMSHWLQDFAYRIPLSAWIFVGAGITGLLIALSTIAYHAFRAARANPVAALRTE
ncbi:MAG TPA: FtsX-like permease family protein [Bryobacteraceae bacterium]